jgi:hypothetical protein
MVKYTTDPNKKQENTIVVEYTNNPHWKGYGYVTITRDGPGWLLSFLNTPNKIH